MALKFDWKDGLLLCTGFVGCIGVLLGLKEAFGVSADEGLVELVGLVTMAGPVVLRRLIFGAPELPEPRRGALPTLLSIVGLLASLFGLLAFGGGALHLMSSLREAPDFERETRAALQQAHETFAVRFPGQPEEDEATTAARLDADAKASAALQQAAWQQSQAEQRSTSLAVAGVGLLLVALGALATWARYRPVAPE